jgi:hypothetical protein
VDNYNLEKVSLEYQMIFSEPLDSRGPLQVDDGPVEGDPLEMFKTEVADKLSQAAAGVAPISVTVPSLDEIIGITGREDEFVVAKHVHVENPDEMTLLKRARCSSGPGRIRLEKTVLDGEVWLFGFDDRGEEIFARPFVEEAAA